MCGHLDTDFFDQSEQCDPVPLYGIWLLGFSFAIDLAPIAERLCRRRPRRARLRLVLPAVDCRAECPLTDQLVNVGFGRRFRLTRRGIPIRVRYLSPLTCLATTVRSYLSLQPNGRSEPRMASSPITTLAERARRARYPPTAVVSSGDYPAAVAATMLPFV
jgi:hypothetical protein